jgi:hypothetical protein
MKTRIALSLATLLLITSAAFAGNPDKAGNPDRDAGQSPRVVADGPRNPDVSDRAIPGIKVPFILDGVEFPAFTKLPTYELTYVLTPEDLSKGTIHIFSSPDVAKVFMDRNRPKNGPTDAQGHRAVTLDTCSWTEDYSWFNTAVGCGNSGVLTLYPLNTYSNLDFGGWNNTISCVKAACVGYYTVIYACRNFQMTIDQDCENPGKFFIPAGSIITDLNVYGFNNRTSSIDFE